MDMRLWLLRAIGDWTLILIAWWTLLNWLGWGAALFLAAYIILVIVTELSLREQQEEDEVEEEQRGYYLIGDGKVLYATPSEYALYLSLQQKEQERLENETKDSVEEWQEDQQDQK